MSWSTSNRWDQALLSFQEVLKLNPHDRDAAYNSGSMLLQLGRLEEALSRLNLSDQLQPNHAPTLQKRALALHELGRSEEALVDIKRAHALDPSQADICNNAGVFLQRLGRDDEALPWIDRALKLRPDYPDAIINKAFSLGASSPVRRGLRALRFHEDASSGSRRRPNGEDRIWTCCSGISRPAGPGVKRVSGFRSFRSPGSTIPNRGGLAKSPSTARPSWSRWTRDREIQFSSCDTCRCWPHGAPASF